MNQILPLLCVIQAKNLEICLINFNFTCSYYFVEKALCVVDRYDFKTQLNEKVHFLTSAYEVASKHSPSNPMSVRIDPIELGKSIGYDKSTVQRTVRELVYDGYVTATLGMKSMMLTMEGFKHLGQMQDSIMTISSKQDDFQKAPQQPDSKSLFMKQSEKLDLILKALYNWKNDGLYYSISTICRENNIPLESVHELRNLANRLKDEGYITVHFTHNDGNATLTTYGIDYCEEDSYSYSGHSIVTNNYSISIVNSPGSNVVNQSSDISISNNFDQAHEAVENIISTIGTDSSIGASHATEILACLNEIQESLQNNRKPKFAIKSLLDMASGISSISSWLTTLGQFAGIVPTP